MAYNITSGTGTRLPDMKNARFYHGCVFARDPKADQFMIIVAGGYNTNYGAIASTELFHLGQGEWMEVDKLKVARVGLRMVAIRDKVYAMGGFGNNSRMDTVEVFDTDLEMWSPGEKLLEQRANYAVTSVPENLFDKI